MTVFGRCEAICTTHGQRCRAPGVYPSSHEQGRMVCGRHRWHAGEFCPEGRDLDRGSLAHMAIALSTPPTKDQVAAIQAEPNGGRGATVMHPRASNRKARTRLIRGLTSAGLEYRVATTLEWVTAAPKVEADEPEQDVEPDPGSYDEPEVPADDPFGSFE